MRSPERPVCSRLPIARGWRDGRWARRVRQLLVVCLAASLLMHAPAAAQGGPNDGFCVRPAPEAACRTFLITETSLPLVSGDRGVYVTAEWKVGLMANVGSRGAVGAAFTLIGSDQNYDYSGIELRYRYWLTHLVAAEAGLGGDWLRPSEAFVGTKQFQTGVRVGLWINDFLGVVGGGSSRDSGRRLVGGPQLGSWLGLGVGAALTGLRLMSP